jgi:hypothetical protein
LTSWLFKIPLIVPTHARYRYVGIYNFKKRGLIEGTLWQRRYCPKIEERRWTVEKSRWSVDGRRWIYVVHSVWTVYVDTGSTAVDMCGHSFTVYIIICVCLYTYEIKTHVLGEWPHKSNLIVCTFWSSWSVGLSNFA